MAELSKYEWRRIADDLLLRQDPEVIERCVRFLMAETSGVSDGRIRAVLARRLKHCHIAAELREILVGCVIARLVEGRFSEQFKDQLRLVLHLDRPRVMASARASAGSSRSHVLRYAEWIMTH